MSKKLEIRKRVFCKIERFIKLDFPKKLNNKKDRIKTFFQNLKSVKESELVKQEDRTLNQVIKDWLLEIFIYGTLVTLCVSLWFKITSIKTMIGMSIMFGIVRWLVLDLIKDIRERLK